MSTQESLQRACKDLRSAERMFKTVLAPCLSRAQRAELGLFTMFTLHSVSTSKAAVLFVPQLSLSIGSTDHGLKVQGRER